MLKYSTREEGPLLPIIKARKVESTSYVLRMTPFGNYDIKVLSKFLSEMTNDYVVSKEVSKNDKEHFHAFFSVELYEDEVREKIREFLKVYFPGPPKRGDANKQYNLQECLDDEQAVKYLLKDGGELMYGEGIDDKALEQRRKSSFSKYSKAEFAKELEDIKAKFKELKWSLGEMMTAVVKLKAKYRQPINMTYIYQLCLSCEIHNNPKIAEEYVQNFLSRVL